MINNHYGTLIDRRTNDILSSHLQLEAAAFHTSSQRFDARGAQDLKSPEGAEVCSPLLGRLNREAVCLGSF